MACTIEPWENYHLGVCHRHRGRVRSGPRAWGLFHMFRCFRCFTTLVTATDVQPGDILFWDGQTARDDGPLSVRRSVAVSETTPRGLDPRVG